MRRTVRAATVAALAAACALTAIPASQAAAPASASAVVAAEPGPDFAPLDRPGPPLRVTEETVAAATTCHGDPRTGPEPVLLNPATTVTPEQNYSWNWMKAFTAQGRAWCAVTMPYSTTGDVQIAGEYLVSAIRSLYARAGRRIGIVGHSQGAMSMRWALRWWPDTRAMVDDIVGFAGTNHGSTLFGQACLSGVTTCPPAMWQQRSDSRFIEALNSGAETFAGISYTEVYTWTDEVVQPNINPATATSAVRTGQGRITNVAVQDVCPTDVFEHIMIGTIDPVAYALGMDALEHDGPADPARIDRSVCTQLYMPYVDPLDLTLYSTVLSILPALVGAELPMITLQGSPMINSEPPLADYVWAGSAPAPGTTPPATAPAESAVRARYLPGKRLARIRVTAAGVLPQGKVVVYDRGRRIARGRLDDRGRVKIRLPRLKPGKHVLRTVYRGAPDTRPSSSPPTKVRVR